MRKEVYSDQKNYQIKKLYEAYEYANRLSALSQSFNYLQVTLTSPEHIRSCSKKYLAKTIIKGKVSTKYIKLEKLERKISSEPDLFSQVIFGPTNDWLCQCKKYNGTIKNNLLGFICPYCNVEIISSRVRRYRTGYIDLVIPVVHTWYIDLLFQLIYDILKIILLINEHNKYINISIEEIEEKIIFEPYLIKNIYLIQIPSYYNGYLSEFFNDVKIFFKSNFNFYSEKVGPEFLLDYLKSINIFDLIISINNYELKNYDSNISLQKRILTNFLFTESRPEWMILTSLPVLPPSSRPFMKVYRQIYGEDRKQNSPFTVFYQNILYLNRYITIYNYKLKSIRDIAKSLDELQNIVDQLIDNSRLPEDKRAITNERIVTSLTENFEGKFGQFRYNMLGKRTNFSGRSVIVTGPTLHLYQCQLPYSMALTLFMPHFISFLQKKLPLNVNSKIDWEDLILTECFFFYKVLSILIQNYLVMLNRAPTLHRFNVQSFSPILTLNKAIGLHPLVCTGFNADFDGDQMAVHLPLYNASQLESYTLHSSQVLTPANGEVILKPSQDIVIGCCYLSVMLKKNRNIFFKYFDEKEDIYLLYSQKKIDLHMPILVNMILNNLCVVKQKNDLILKNNNLKMLHYKTKIIKFIKSNDFIYLFLDCGIILIKKLYVNKYTIVKIYIKTTPGRVFFGDFINTLLK